MFRLGPVQADFFLPGVALDFMHIRQALADGFPNPLVHLVFILIEPITAKDVAARKRWWCRSSRVFADRRIVGTLGIPPGSLEDIEGVVYPRRSGLVLEVTQIFDRCGAKSGPTPGTFGFLLWLDQRILYQVGSDMPGLAIPGVGKISQGCPGVFSLPNPFVGVGHGIDRCREWWRLSVPVSIILSHKLQGFKLHNQPSLPKSWFRAFSIRSAFFCCPLGKM